MVRKALPAGFIVPAQPVERTVSPSGASWVHEIKHDGFRMIVRRDGDQVRLFSRKALDWTGRLPAIAKGAAGLKAKSFTIDGEAVVIGPDGLTDFDALRRREAGELAVLYAFDLIEYDGDDLRALPLETRKATLASLLRKPTTIRFSEHVEADAGRVRPGLQARRRGHRVEAARLAVPLGPVPNLDQGKEPGRGGGAARAVGKLEPRAVTRRKATRLVIEAAVLAELRALPGCQGVVSVTINAVAGRGTTWSLTTFNPGRADGERCAETLREIVARLQAELDFAEDPVRPMPGRL
jgi:bifunctional non-homologous end joining protein LigD